MIDLNRNIEICAGGGPEGWVPAKIICSNLVGRPGKIVVNFIFDGQELYETHNISSLYLRNKKEVKTFYHIYYRHDLTNPPYFSCLHFTNKNSYENEILNLKSNLPPYQHYKMLHHCEVQVEI